MSLFSFMSLAYNLIAQKIIIKPLHSKLRCILARQKISFIYCEPGESIALAPSITARD
jgi:hypothetical protein